MIIIFAHKLSDDIKTRLLTEIKKVRLDTCVAITQKTPDDTVTEILTEIEKRTPGISITEDVILQYIPRLLENQPDTTTDKSGLSLDEKNARKYHTKNMMQLFNTAKQKHAKQLHHKNVNRHRR
jgi:hypothetical protein